MNAILRFLLAITLWAVFVGTLWAVLTPPKPSIPRCQEDAVLMGVDDFHDGRWTRYVCGPSVDDYL